MKMLGIDLRGGWSVRATAMALGLVCTAGLAHADVGSVQAFRDALLQALRLS
jgi:hypothetical protein